MKAISASNGPLRPSAAHSSPRRSRLFYRWCAPVSENDALVPEWFLRVPWSRLAGGATPPELVERMVRLIRDFRKRERGLP